MRSSQSDQRDFFGSIEKSIHCPARQPPTQKSIHLFKPLVLDRLQNNSMIAAIHKHTITLAHHELLRICNINNQSECVSLNKLWMAIISVPLSSANIKGLQNTDDFMYRRMKTCSGRGSACQFIMGGARTLKRQGTDSRSQSSSPHQSLQLIMRRVTGFVSQTAHPNHQRMPFTAAYNAWLQVLVRTLRTTQYTRVRECQPILQLDLPTSNKLRVNYKW